MGAPTGPDGGAGAAGDDAQGRWPPQEALRRRLLDVAAQALTTLEEAAVPAPLRRVRTFAPARRARAGAPPITACLTSDARFRRAVAAAWEAGDPRAAAAVRAVQPPGAEEPGTAQPGTAQPGTAQPDPLEVAVAAWLLRPEGWGQVVDAAARDTAEDAARRRAAEDAQRSAREVETLRAREASLRADLAAARAEADALREEVSTARRGERRARSDADRARAAQRAAEHAAGEAARALEQACADLEQQRRRAEAAERQVAEGAAATQHAARRARSVDDVRARLLLDTLLDAASSLRRELALPPVDLSPTDLLTEELLAEETARTAPAQTVGARGLAASDPAALDQLLALPRVHLVVDGYNVTKLGFGQLPLLEQRRRLVDGLHSIAARTGAEVTCCFDGSDAVGPVPSAGTRRVRVLFSATGSTADELIRRIVRAEPAGRPVVVVSDDGEVVAGVRAAGARPLSSRALLARLARG